MIVNGYNISGNVAAVGREYHVSNAAGAVLHKADGKVSAVTWAEAAETGDVEDVKPIVPSEQKTVAPKTTAPKKAAKKKAK